MKCTNNQNLTLSHKMIKRMECNNHFCSFEVSPPRTSAELPELLKSVDNLHQICAPLFYAVTWHTRGSSVTLNDTNPCALQLISAIKGLKQDILLHLAAAGLSQENILDISNKAQTLGINNIFALRGDCKSNAPKGDFPHAINLVQFIRKHYGTGIVICVAGYPAGHPDAESYAEDLKHLKEKVDAGANFIITQILFEAQSFINFVKDCRSIGITVPIIPGIMPIQDYTSLQRISQLCRLEVPKTILDILEPIKDNSKSVLSFGICHAIEMAKQILSSNSSSGLHFYTLNREFAVLVICKQLGLGVSDPMKPLQHTMETVTESD